VSYQTVSPELIVYPNPFREELWMKFYSETDKVAALQIYSAEGRLIYQGHVFVKAGLHNYELPASVMGNSGFYLLQLQDGQKMIRKRVIRN